jgi:hypothetical protein
MKNYLKLAFVSFLAAVNSACVEEVTIDFGDDQSNLVVHAIITDELKHQEITLSRTYPFDIKEAPAEKGALITLNTNGQSFPFEEVEEGRYRSVDLFKAETGTAYQLSITTSNGSNYISESKSLVGSVSINDFSIKPGFNEDNEEGLSFELSSNKSNSEGNYYRIDYEETYKIIAPYWSAYDAVIFAEGFHTVDVRAILRETEEKECYGNFKSTRINLVNTYNFQADEINNLPVRFLKKYDPKGMYRYSIEVRQYAVDAQTYSYYQSLKEISDASTTVFTQSQPGQINSNIYSESNPEEVVLGYFEVSGVDSRRVFVDYRDYYPEGNRPNYFYACQTSVPSISGTMGNRPLLEAIKSDELVYFASTEPGHPDGPFVMVLPFCGDCTRIGSNIKPEFWIDED